MNVRFTKAECSPWGGGTVCLQLGDGIDRHIHPDNAPLVLRELKAAMGVDDNDQDALIAELVGALNDVATWLEINERAIDVNGASAIDRRVHKALAKASGGEGA